MLTANLKPLERRGLIQIAVDKEDRRGRRLSLTAKGKALLGAAALIWIEMHFETEKLLTAIGTATFGPAYGRSPESDRTPPRILSVVAQTPKRGDARPSKLGSLLQRRTQKLARKAIGMCSHVRTF